MNNLKKTLVLAALNSNVVAAKVMMVILVLAVVLSSSMVGARAMTKQEKKRGYTSIATYFGKSMSQQRPERIERQLEEEESIPEEWDLANSNHFGYNQFGLKEGPPRYVGTIQHRKYRRAHVRFTRDIESYDLTKLNKRYIQKEINPNTLTSDICNHCKREYYTDFIKVRKVKDKGEINLVVIEQIGIEHEGDDEIHFYEVAIYEKKRHVVMAFEVPDYHPIHLILSLNETNILDWAKAFGMHKYVEYARKDEGAEVFSFLNKVMLLASSFRPDDKTETRTGYVETFKTRNGTILRVEHIKNQLNDITTVDEDFIKEKLKEYRKAHIDSRYEVGYEELERIIDNEGVTLVRFGAGVLNKEKEEIDSFYDTIVYDKNQTLHMIIQNKDAGLLIKDVESINVMGINKLGLPEYNVAFYYDLGNLKSYWNQVLRVMYKRRKAEAAKEAAAEAKEAKEAENQPMQYRLDEPYLDSEPMLYRLDESYLDSEPMLYCLGESYPDSEPALLGVH